MGAKGYLVKSITYSFVRSLSKHEWIIFIAPLNTQNLGANPHHHTDQISIKNQSLVVWSGEENAYVVQL